MLLSKYEQALYYEISKNEEYKIIKEKIKESQTVFDIWSHLWFFSLWCLDLNQNLKIHTFEASKENYERSKEILKDFWENIVFNNAFVDYQNWIKDLYLNQEKSMQSSFYNNQFLCSSDTKKEVNCIDLMWYIKENSIKSIDIVKIDIEGYEFELLLNISESFFTITKTLVFEYHILFPEFNLKYEILLEKLKKFYKIIEFYPSKYNKKVGIIICEK